MKIIVIGNGFDLNLGLPTRYEDFIKSPVFKELMLSHINNKLAIHLKTIFDNQKWVDIENELTEYSNINDEDFEKDYNQLIQALIIYLEDIDYTDINTESKAYKEILNIDKTDLKIINFNYTNSIKNILIANGFTAEKAKELIYHIHGSLDEKSIIFGVEDNANIKSEHIFLKKAFNPSFKSININQLLINANEVTFFGHSLGNTDHSYFETFFTLKSSTQNIGPIKLKLFYYGKENYKALFEELDFLSNNNLTALRQTNQFELIDSSK